MQVSTAQKVLAQFRVCKQGIRKAEEGAQLQVRQGKFLSCHHELASADEGSPFPLKGWLFRQ
jgi:hypothetical protein